MQFGWKGLAESNGSLPLSLSLSHLCAHCLIQDQLPANAWITFTFTLIVSFISHRMAYW